MGLLDDAIRDHLELKRRRGADPAEVAREQHEALDAVADRAAQRGLDASDESAVESTAAAREGDLPPATTEHAPTQSAEAGLARSAQSEGAAVAAEEPPGMEETAELDMKAVLERAEHAPPEEPAQVSEPLPGQEHLQFEQDSPPRAEPAE